jgi:hypothetical protein
MIKVGDKVKLFYISDGNPQNNQLGIVIKENMYKYYPNGDPNEYIWKQGCIIQYPDNSTYSVEDTERKGSGVVSPLIKIED